MQPWAGGKIDKVAGIEARGFILGGAVAHQLSAGFVPIRKKGKLPHQTVRMAYALEYGIDEMEMHVDAVSPGERVILVDDLIATGGTAIGAVNLLAQDRRRGRGGVLHHRPARPRRRQEARGARRAGAHAHRLRGTLNARAARLSSRASGVSRATRDRPQEKHPLLKTIAALGRDDNAQATTRPRCRPGQAASATRPGTVRRKNTPS